MKHLTYAITAIILLICVCLTGCTSKKITTITEEEIITEVTSENSSKAPTSSNTSSRRQPSSSKPQSNNKPSSSISPVSSNNATSGEIIELPDSSILEEYSSSVQESVLPEEITRPTLERYCYSQLTPKQKSAYKTIVSMLRNTTSGFVKLEGLAIEDIPLVFQSVNNDYPEFFWMPNRYVIAHSSNNYYIAMNYTDDDREYDYLYSNSEIRKINQELEDLLDELKTIITGKTEYEKELQIHDYLCENITYSTSLDDRSIYNIYGALIKGDAVCEGYSRAMQYLCRYFNIDCLLVTGMTKDIGHMWNQVRIDKKWYNLDVTWNDVASSGAHHWYSYFNVTDEIISMDHVFDVSLSELPEGAYMEDGVSYNLFRMVCNSTDASYAYINDLLLSSDPVDIKFVVSSAVLKAVNSGKDYVELFLLPEIDITGKESLDLYDYLNIKDAVKSANTLLAANGKPTIMVTSYSVNGRGFRFSFDAS